MTAPVWGCPWHGRVVNRTLHLPGIGTRQLPFSYSQAVEHSRPLAGDTVLVQIPGLPDVVRTPDEQVVDAANGWQWWNRAILATGRRIVAGVHLDGHLYIDPAGVAWRVSGMSRDLLAAQTIVLSRFGVFGGSAEEYSYTVDVPDYGQSSPALDGVERMEIYFRDAVPDGSAALYAILTDVQGVVPYGFSGTANSRDRWRPSIGWLELRITGPASAADVSISLIRNREQCIGELEQDVGLPPERYRFGVSVDTTIRYEDGVRHTEEVPSLVLYPPSGGAEDQYLVGPGECVSYAARKRVIVALWYAGEAIEELTVDYERSVRSVVSEPEITLSGRDYSVEGQGLLERYTYDWSIRGDTTYTSAITLRIDGEQVDRRERSWLAFQEQSYSRTAFPPGSDPGVLVDDSASDGPYYPGIQPKGLAAAPSTPPSEFAAARYLSLDSHSFRTGDRSSNYVNYAYCPYLLSNHLAGVLESRRAADGWYWSLGRVVAPFGLVDEAAQAAPWAPNLRFYGSWCPATRTIASDTAPTYWI